MHPKFSNSYLIEFMNVNCLFTDDDVDLGTGVILGPMALVSLVC